MPQPPFPSCLFLTEERNTLLLSITSRKDHIPLQNTNKEIQHSLTTGTTSHVSQSTYWGRGEHRIHLYSSDNLLSLQKRSKPCLLFSLPFPIIRHYLLRIHDVRLRLPRVMLDSITLPGNLVVGLGVLNASKSMPPHTQARVPFQLDVVGVVPGRLPCTAQEATHETQDGYASQHSSLTCTLRVAQPARLQMDQSIWEEACETFRYA
jgi:hypothetical protein